MKDLIEEAMKVIAASDEVQATMVMIGLPVGYDTSADDPTTRSANTEGKCSWCRVPVMSSELKDTILMLTKHRRPAERPVLLCGECLFKVTKAEADKKVVVKGMYKITGEL